MICDGERWKSGYEQIGQSIRVIGRAISASLSVCAMDRVSGVGLCGRALYRTRAVSDGVELRSCHPLALTHSERSAGARAAQSRHWRLASLVDTGSVGLGVSRVS